MQLTIPTISPWDSLTLLRLTLIAFTTVMFLLDCIHITQVRKTHRLNLLSPLSPQTPPLPWPFSSLLSSLTFPDTPITGPPISDLNGYFTLLILPDLFVICMMCWLMVGRQCRDKHYRVGLRCGFFVVVGVLILWWPVEEIGRVRRYTERMYGGLADRRSWERNRRSLEVAGVMLDDAGGILRLTHQRRQEEEEMQRRVRILEEDFVSSEIVILPTGPRLVAAMAIDKEEKTDAIVIATTQLSHSSSTTNSNDNSQKRSYEWTPPSTGSVYFCFLNHLDKAPYAPFINCGIYRTRNIFALIVFSMLVGEITFSALKGEMTLREGSTVIVANTSAGPPRPSGAATITPAAATAVVTLAGPSLTIPRAPIGSAPIPSAPAGYKIGDIIGGRAAARGNGVEDVRRGAGRGRNRATPSK